MSSEEVSEELDVLLKEAHRFKAQDPVLSSHQ